MNVVLIGYRGTGKTTVARRLGEMTGWAVEDTDAEIVRRAGRTIAEIFAEAGEEAFRDLEAEVVAELAARDGIVLACGGGVVLREANRDALRDRGRVVWLKAGLETIFTRLDADAATRAQRPPLTDRDAREEVQTLLEARAPLYAECAEVEVETDGREVEAIAREIAAAVNLDVGG